MKQEYKDLAYPNHVCKLTKALYGLKQTPRAWFAMLSSFLLSNGFTNSFTDSSLFILSKDTIVIYLHVYVDDIILTRNNSESLTVLIKVLSSRFAMKDLGSLNYFLGLEVQRDASGLVLTQTKYATELLHKVRMTKCKPSPSPSSVKPTHLNPDPLFQDVTLFRTLVGSLQYLTLTRPEISYPVNQEC